MSEPAGRAEGRLWRGAKVEYEKEGNSPVVVSLVTLSSRVEFYCAQLQETLLKFSCRPIKSAGQVMI